MHYRFTRPVGRLVTSLLFAGLLAIPLSACDSNGADDEITIRGRVSDDASSGAVLGPIEGATVVAAEVATGGEVTTLAGGQATTDADGAYEMSVEGTTRAVVLTATSGSFTTRALIEAGGAAAGTVSAPTMTTETDAEVDVFLAAQALPSAATVADVAFYVTRDLAGRISGGAESAEDVAVAIDAALRTEAAYADERGSSGAVDDAAEEREDAYGSYRVAVFAATTTTGGAAARVAFEEAYSRGFDDAGADVDVQAGAALAASVAAARFDADLTSSAAFDLQRQARLHAALAGAFAVEDHFRAAGVTGRLTALANAREALHVDIAGALTAGAIAGAEDAYRALIRAELATETGLSAGDLADAEAATASARTALGLTVAAATTPALVAEAVATFHAAVRTAVAASLGAGEDLAVDVIVLTSLSLAAGA